MFRDCLDDDVAGINRASTSGPDPCAISVGPPDSVVGAVIADVGILERADPYPGAFGDGPICFEGDPFLTRKELLVAALRLDRLEDHRPENGPLSQQLHSAAVDLYRLIDKHRLQSSASLVLD